MGVKCVSVESTDCIQLTGKMMVLQIDLGVLEEIQIAKMLPSGHLEDKSRAEHQVMPEDASLEITPLKMIAEAMEMDELIQ